LLYKFLATIYSQPSLLLIPVRHWYIGNTCPMAYAITRNFSDK